MRARFGDFVLDLTQRELLERNEPKHLSTKAFLLLEFLVKSAPRALTKEELYRHMWGDTIVEEVNLPNLISEVRSALGDNRKRSRFIKTIHSYGYAFAGEVTVESEVEVKKRRRESLFSLRWAREEFPLMKKVNIVGRGDEVDVAIDSGAVSRRHARITVTPGSATIEDLGSKNGTFVRGERIDGIVPLHDGEEIRLGYLALTFHVTTRQATTVSGMA